jgi:elongation factor Ts
MAEITAKQVQALRAKTDLAMMDCKSALVEAGGDEARAMEILRKKFADKMSTRADKEAANGRIGVFADDSAAALVEVRCETDFVATNDAFRSLADAIAEQCARSGITDVEQLKAARGRDGRPVGDLLVDAFGKLKENLSIRRAVRIVGAGACYVHHNGKVAAAVTADKSPGEAGRQICMHIASAALLVGLSREQVGPAEVEAARAKAREEIKGKPEQIIDKIVSGKMDRWFAERVLLEQPFVMDDKKSVGAFAREKGFSVTGYVKYEVGGLG